MVKAVLPLAFALLLLCKVTRHVLDAAPGTALADVLTAGSVLALTGIAVGLVGRLWLFWRAHRAGT